MKNAFLIARGSKWLAIVISSLVLSGCQSLAISLTQHAMENPATQQNGQRLTHYANQNVQHPLQVARDVRYGDLPNSRMDVIVPQQHNNKHYPVIVLVHGGGWVAGNKESMLPYAKLLADRGFAVVNMEYSRVPQSAFPTQLRQLNQVLTSLKALSYPSLDLNRLFLSGDSAGANIVSNYAALVNSPILQHQLAITPAIRAQQLKGLVLHSGVYDMASLYQSGSRLPWYTRWIMQDLLNAYSGENPASLRRLYAMSATPWLTTHYPPVWISASDNDLLTSGQSRPFIQRLQQLKVPVDIHLYPQQWPEPLNHDFEFNLSYRASREVLENSVEFIKQHSKSR